MTIAELKRAKDQRPFSPFTVRMADGRELEIRHPDAIAWEDDSRRIAVCMLKGGAWEVIDVSQVTSLGMSAPAGNSQSNGGE